MNGNSLPRWLSLTAIVALFAILLVICLPLLPFDDDIYYIAPVPAFDPTGLMPHADQWRPLDYLFRAILGLQPALYPALNHIAVVCGHLVNLGLFVRICTRYLGAERKNALIGALILAISPAVAVAVFSIDSLNQVWSMAFGLAACSLLMQRMDLPHAVAALACCWVAVFWKESGITFFIVAPLAAWMVSLSRRHLDSETADPIFTRAAHAASSDSDSSSKGAVRYLALLAISIICCLAYFGLRFALLGSTQLGTEGRYALSLSPGHILRNLAVMVGVNLSPIDSIAVLLTPRNLPLAAFTGVLGLPLLAWIIWASVKSLRIRRQRRALFALALLALIAISPYLVMGSAGEMHAYQLTPFYAAGIVLLAKWRHPAFKPWLALALVAFAAASLITDAHKWIDMKAMGDSTLPVYEAVIGAYSEDEHPETVTGFAIESGDEPLYSVFSMTVSDASEAGQIAGAYWGWRWPAQFECIDIPENLSPDQLKELYPDRFAASDSIWIVTHDGEVTVLKQGEDY